MLDRICYNCMTPESELTKGLLYCPATNELLCSACYDVTLDYIAILHAAGRLAEAMK